MEKKKAGENVDQMLEEVQKRLARTQPYVKNRRPQSERLRMLSSLIRQSIEPEKGVASQASAPRQQVQALVEQPGTGREEKPEQLEDYDTESLLEEVLGKGKEAPPKGPARSKIEYYKRKGAIEEFVAPHIGELPVRRPSKPLPEPQKPKSIVEELVLPHFKPKPRVPKPPAPPGVPEEGGVGGEIEVPKVKFKKKRKKRKKRRTEEERAYQIKARLDEKIKEIEEKKRLDAEHVKRVTQAQADRAEAAAPPLKIPPAEATPPQDKPPIDDFIPKSRPREGHVYAGPTPPAQTKPKPAAETTSPKEPYHKPLEIRVFESLTPVEQIHLGRVVQSMLPYKEQYTKSEIIRELVRQGYRVTLIDAILKELYK